MAAVRSPTHHIISVPEHESGPSWIACPRPALLVVVIVDEHPAAARTRLFGRFNDPAVNPKGSEGGVDDAVRQARMTEATEISTHD
jgi:hypothetical protein